MGGSSGGASGGSSGSGGFGGYGSTKSPGGTGYGGNVGGYGTAGEMSGGAGGAGMAGYGGGGMAGVAGSGWGGPGGSAGRQPAGGTFSNDPSSGHLNYSAPGGYTNPAAARIGGYSVQQTSARPVQFSTPIPTTVKPLQPEPQPPAYNLVRVPQEVGFPPSIYASAYQNYNNYPQPNYPNANPLFRNSPMAPVADPQRVQNGYPSVSGTRIPASGFNPGNAFVGNTPQSSSWYGGNRGVGPIRGGMGSAGPTGNGGSMSGRGGFGK